MKRYVLGFMFNNELTEVALIRKLKPEWQAGLLNGIGGKIEEGEVAREAMIREFHEEAGLQTKEADWYYVVPLGNGTDWEMSVFAAKVPTLAGEVLKSMEEEEVIIEYLSKIHPLRIDMIDNLPWLIAQSRFHLLSTTMEDGQ